jgi:hypothetical protein
MYKKASIVKKEIEDGKLLIPSAIKYKSLSYKPRSRRIMQRDLKKLNE